MPVNPLNPMVVQSDHTVLLEVNNSQYAEARDALARFAELEKSPEHIHTYRLTALSLWNAAAAGMSADEMVEALGHYLNALLFLEEGDDYQASVELERSLESQELPPEVVQLTLQGPLKEKGSKAWSEARRRRQGDVDDKGQIGGAGG